MSINSPDFQPPSSLSQRHPVYSLRTIQANKFCCVTPSPAIFTQLVPTVLNFAFMLCTLAQTSTLPRHLPINILPA